jgi:hypothetical protein
MLPDEERLAELDAQIELITAWLAELCELRTALLEGAPPLFVDEVLGEDCG